MPLNTLKFNGESKPWLYLLEGRSKSPFAPVRNNLLRVQGVPGAYIESTDTDVLYITQPVGFLINNNEEAMRIKDELASWLLTDEPAPLEFSDESGRTYYAKIEGTIEDLTRLSKQRRGTLTFLCADPYSYGEEETETFANDTATVNVTGTAPTFPVIELDVLQPITFAMVQNQNNNYMMIGQPISAEETAVEPTTNILTDTMNSLVGWTNATHVDNGTISGTMSANANGFYVSDFGTGTGWIGPAVKKSLSEPLQNFESQIEVENLNLAGGMGMIEVYFLDVNENTVAKLGIEDAWDLAKMQAKMQLGNLSDRYSQYGEPQRVSNWYDYKGIMRIARRGQEWTAYFAVLVDGVYRYPYLMKYTDGENKYQNPIAQVQIAIRKRPTTAATNMSVKLTVVDKVNDLSNFQIPYIANPGDKVIFDHKNKDILVNGESKKSLINFGSNFFPLVYGENILKTFPAGSIGGNTKYRNAYK